MSAEDAFRSNQVEAQACRLLHMYDPCVRDNCPLAPLPVREFSAEAAGAPGAPRPRGGSSVFLTSLFEDEETATRPSPPLQSHCLLMPSAQQMAGRLHNAAETAASSAAPQLQQQQQEQQPFPTASPAASECGGDTPEAAETEEAEEPAAPLDELSPLSVYSLFEEGQHGSSFSSPLTPTPSRAEQEEEEVLATRWECRVVTPCVGLGVDLFSAEGCGLVLCGHPFSLFSNCCAVELPGPYVITSRPRPAAEKIMATHLSSFGRIPVTADVLGSAKKAASPKGEQETFKSPQVSPEYHADTSVRPISIFVGTWNTEYQEFAPEYISSLEAQLHARGEYDSKAATTSVEWGVPTPTLHASQSTASTLTMGPEAEIDSRQGSDSDATTRSEKPPSIIQRRSTINLSKPGPNEQPLRDWLMPGYDIYVVTLQEVTNDNVFDTITLYLEVEHGERYLRVNMGDGKISGLGKGAWTKMKATSMACWIRESVRSPMGPVTPLAYKAFSFTMINGSKGAVTLALRILNQTVCFVGCHMPASGVKERSRARQHIRKKLALVYSSSPDVDFARVFHHVIWAGDFNFRLQTSLDVCLPLLRNMDIEGLLQYDECREDMGQDMQLHQLREAPVTFLPTYKKADARPPLDITDRDWVLKEYQVTMKKGVLGQKKVVERPPSWCDRVFYWSMPAVDGNLLPAPDAYFAATPKDANVLMASDHAPVGCGLHLFALAGEAPRIFFDASGCAKAKSKKA